MGSEFEIQLPRRDPNGLERRQPPNGSGLGPRRLLIIEDNTDAAEMLRDLLEGRGHTVLLAPNGASALELLPRATVDAILCDLGLPGMSGYDVARAIRAQPLHQRTPLIAVTGYSQREDRRRSAEAGFDGHLVKPVTLQGLEEVLAGFATSEHASQ